MNYGEWATGYTGTVNIDLPEPQYKINKFNTKINEDTDEKIGVYYALTGKYNINKTGDNSNSNNMISIIANYWVFSKTSC